MAGLLPVATSFAEPRLHLGYRRIKLLGGERRSASAGATFRGHEFHYASLIEAGDAAPLFEVDRCAPASRSARPGAPVGTVCGSFLHLIDRASERRAPTDPAQA